MKTVVSEKGQITIPKKIRMDMGITPGTVLDFQEEGGRLLIRKIVQENPIRAWRGRGKLPGNLSVDDYLNKVRGK